MIRDIGSLPPTQYLVMVVLAARRRLGEPDVTLPASVTTPVNALRKAGLVRVTDLQLGSIRIELTEAGIEASGAR